MCFEEGNWNIDLSSNVLIGVNLKIEFQLNSYPINGCLVYLEFVIFARQP